MADTRVQLEVEDWVRREFLLKHFGIRFRRERVKLSSGGFFDFDAVSEDDKIAITISTSSAMTAGGNFGSGKLMKIRSDIYFLLLANCERRVVALTQKDMLDAWMKEKAGGRVAKGIEFVLAELPADLAERLSQAKSMASGEVSPKG